MAIGEKAKLVSVRPVAVARLETVDDRIRVVDGIVSQGAVEVVGQESVRLLLEIPRNAGHLPEEPRSTGVVEDHQVGARIELRVFVEEERAGSRTVGMERRDGRKIGWEWKRCPPCRKSATGSLSVSSWRILRDAGGDPETVSKQRVPSPGASHRDELVGEEGVFGPKDHRPGIVRRDPLPRVAATPRPLDGDGRGPPRLLP
jgi:hypothetical protein